MRRHRLGFLPPLTKSAIICCCCGILSSVAVVRAFAFSHLPIARWPVVVVRRPASPLGPVPSLGFGRRLASRKSTKERRGGTTRGRGIITMASPSSPSPAAPAPTPRASCTASVFIATSRDGFIAKPDGSVDWLNALHASHPLPEGEDGGFSAFMDSVDALVMGRKTFDSVLCMMKEDATIPWAYGDKPVAVWSRHPEGVVVPADLGGTVRAVGGNPRSVLDSLASPMEEEEGGCSARDVYVDGGETIRCFVEAGLVGRVVVTVVPVTLGEGISLFTEEQWGRMEEVGVKRYENGFVQTTYRVAAEEAKDAPKDGEDGP